jgi:hypothetical protein
MDRTFAEFRFSILGCLLIPLSLSAQTHPITIHSNQRVASLQMTPSEYSAWIAKDEFEDAGKLKALTQDIYRKFNDEFDFIFLVLNEEESPVNIDYAGQLISVSRQDKGLGGSTFDNGKDYGSAGRLKSVMALTQSDFVMSGPSLHELMHTWGNFAISAGAFDPFGPGSGAISNYKPHWGFTGGSTEGQLGGFKQSTLVENVGGKANRYRTASFGQFANGGNSVPYSEFELYLMGMLPVSSVTPFDVFRGLTAYDESSNEFEATTRVRYDPARIVSELGERQPSSLASRKDFRLLIVVLCGAPLTTAEWNGYDKDSEAFGKPGSDGSYLYNFWEATGGKGTMETGKLNGALKGTAIYSLSRPLRAGAAFGLSRDALYTLTGRRHSSRVKAPAD